MSTIPGFWTPSKDKRKQTKMTNFSAKRTRSPTPVRSEEKPLEKRVKIEAQSPTIAKVEETEELPDEKPNDSQKVDEGFAVRSDEENETEEPRDESPPKDGQKKKERAIKVPVDKVFAAHNNGKSR